MARPSGYNLALPKSTKEQLKLIQASLAALDTSRQNKKKQQNKNKKEKKETTTTTTTITMTGLNDDEASEKLLPPLVDDGIDENDDSNILTSHVE